MTIQENTYTIYPSSGVYYILATENLTVTIYDREDTTYSDPLITIAVIANEETSLELCDDNFYVIKVTNGVFTNYHDFIYFPFLHSKFIDEVGEYICSCENCLDNVLNDCLDCKETDECKTNLAFLSYVFAHIHLFTDEEYMDGFPGYMHDVLLQYATKLKDRYTTMFYYGMVKGTYPIELRDLAIYYSAIYIYYYLKEYNEDIDSVYVNTKYDIVNFKKCLSAIGIAYSNLLSIFNNNVTQYGKYYVADLSGIADLCLDIPDLLTNPTITRTGFETGVNITVAVNPKHIILIIPKTWGLLTGIYDLGGMNLLIDTTQTECGSYYVYQFNNMFPPNTYFFRIES